MGAQIFGNKRLSEDIRMMSNERLKSLFQSTEELSNEIDNVYRSFDISSKQLLTFEEFKKLCNQVDPMITEKIMQKLYQVMEVSVVDEGNKTIDLEQFKAYFLPIFKSKIEYEIFSRKIITHSREMGMTKNKINQITNNIEGIVMHNSYRLK